MKSKELTTRAARTVKRSTKTGQYVRAHSSGGRATSGTNAATQAAVVTVGGGLDALVDRVRALVQELVKNGSLPHADAEAAVRAFEDRLPDDVDPTEELGPYFDTPGLRRRLGVTRQALNARVHRNSVLGVEADDGTLLYPSWQFGPDMAVVDGLPQLLRILTQAAPDGFSKAVWLTARQPRFGDRSAAELLAEGAEVEPLLEAAQADVNRLAS